jgi:hypothetical protein
MHPPISIGQMNVTQLIALRGFQAARNARGAMPPAELAHGSCYFSGQKAVNSGERDHTRSFTAKIGPTLNYTRAGLLGKAL